MTINNSDFIAFLYKKFPNAKCVLNFETPFQCIVAVSLSAQTTDKLVNKVTVKLFNNYPDPSSMSKSSVFEIENLIKPLGLYKNKARNLKLLSEYIVEKWSGKIKLDFDELIKLPGVGRKTANVVLAECTQRPAIAVDTHIARISKRLNFARDSDSPDIIENKLEAKFPKDIWISLHHKMIFFGREICHSQNPLCDQCPFGNCCKYYKKNSSKISK